MVTTNLNAWPACRPVHASRLKFKFAADPKVVSRADSVDLLAHKVFTDYRVVARWTSQQGWADSEKDRFAPMSVSPTVSFLHYSTSCFEMMKVDRKLRLFRSEYNCVPAPVSPYSTPMGYWSSSRNLVRSNVRNGFQSPAMASLCVYLRLWLEPMQV